MHRTLFFLGLLDLCIGSPLSSQEGRFQIAAHAGADSEGRRLLGGQVGVAVARFAILGVSGSDVNVEGPARATNWDLSLRLSPWSWKVRPHFLAGVALEHASAPGLPTVNAKGVLLGAGIEAGRGLLRGFAEARVVRTGTILTNLAGGTHGWFWGGLRVHLRR